MIVIDTNALIVLIIGSMDVGLLKSHKRTSIYEEEDFYNLLEVVHDIRELLVLPNVWTETDNLLNDFSGNYKYPYILKLTELLKATCEKYIESIDATLSESFFDLGLTDSLILDCAKDCKMLITSDSKLSDYATARNIKVYDMVRARNDRFTYY